MTVATQPLIVQLYFTYYHRAADPQGLSFWLQRSSAGESLESIATFFAGAPEATAEYAFLAAPQFADPGLFVNQIYNNAFNRVPDAEGFAFWTNYLNNNRGNSTAVANFILFVTQNASGVDVTTLANKGTVSQDFFNKFVNTGAPFDSAAVGASQTSLDLTTDTAASVTAAKAQTDIFIASVGANSGTSFVLTTALNNIPGTPQNDTITGDNSIPIQGTTQAGDVINGGGGDDTFKFFAARNGIVPQLKDVENVQLIRVVNDTEFDFTNANANGLKTVTIVDNPLATVNIKGIGGVTLGIQNDTSNFKVNADFGNTVTSATISTKASYNKDTLAGVGKVTLTGTKVETLNFKTEGESKFEDLITAGTAIKAINAEGTGSLLLSAVDDPTAGTGTPVNANIKTIDASKLTAGGLGVALGTGITSFKGGKGNDAVVTQALTTTTASAIDAGDGTADKLIVRATTDIDTNPKADLYANFEVLQVNGAITADISKFSKSTFDTIRSGGSAVFNKLTATQGNNITIFNTGGAPTFNLASAGSSTDTLKIAFDNGLPGTPVNIAVTNINAPDVEQLEINAVDKVKIGSLAGVGALTNLVLKGDASVDVTTGALTLNGGTTVNASAVNNTFIFDASAAAGTQGLSITGTASNNANTITTTKNSDVITGGGGDDLLTGGRGADRQTGGAGSDTFASTALNQSVGYAFANGTGDATKIDNGDTLTFAGSVVDVITDFASGTDKLDLVAGAGVAPTNLNGLVNAAPLVAGTNYYLLGTYVGGVFTINNSATASTGNVATLVLQGDGAVFSNLAGVGVNPTGQILQGATSLVATDII